MFIERRGIEAAPIFNSMCGDYEPYMDRNVLNEPEFNYFKPTKNHSNSLSVNIKLLLLGSIIAYYFSFIYKNY
jgi:hypothetical protein